MKRYFLSEDRHSQFEQHVRARKATADGCVLSRSGIKIALADELSARVRSYQQNATSLRLRQDMVVVNHTAADCELCAEEYAAQLQSQTIDWNIRSITGKLTAEQLPEVLSLVPRGDVVRTARHAGLLKKSNEWVGSTIAGLGAFAAVIGVSVWGAPAIAARASIMMHNEPFQFWCIVASIGAVCGFFAAGVAKSFIDRAMMNSSLAIAIWSGEKTAVSRFGAKIADLMLGLPKPLAFIIADWQSLDRFSRETIVHAAAIDDESNYLGIVLWVVLRNTNSGNPEGVPVPADECWRTLHYSLERMPAVFPEGKLVSQGNVQ